MIFQGFYQASQKFAIGDCDKSKVKQKTYH